MAEREEPIMDMKQIGLGLFAILLLMGTAVKVCGQPAHRDASKENADAGSETTAEPSAALATDEAPTAKPGLSAPIAAAWTKDGVLVVAGLDVPAKAIRVQRIDSKDHIVKDSIGLDDVKWSTDSDLKIATSPDGGVGVLWHGLWKGKLGRTLAVLGPDLVKKQEPVSVATAHCVTKDGMWFADDTTATMRGWAGEKAKVSLPKDKDVSLFCASHRAFGVIEDDDKSTLLPLGGGDAGSSGGAVTMMKESDFGEDSQRELSEYNVDDTVGVVRLSLNGALAFREMSGSTPGPLHTLKTAIGQDDDVVAVDATPAEIVVVYTQDVSPTCPPDAQNPTQVSTRVQALRVSRDTFEESVVELSPGRCGIEVGPFFTGAISAQELSVSWAERAGGAGKSRAPVVGLAHATVGLGHVAFARIDQAADSLVDGGCDGAHCWAAALARGPDNDVMKPGFIKVLRW